MVLVLARLNEPEGNALTFKLRSDRPDPSPSLRADESFHRPRLTLNRRSMKENARLESTHCYVAHCLVRCVSIAWR